MRSDSNRRPPRLTIARRELRMLTAEKTIVLALAIQLFVAAFSSFLVVGLVSLYDPTGADGYQIEAAVTGDAADELLAAAGDHERIEATAYTDLAGAQTAFRTGQADVLFVATWQTDPDDEADRLRVTTSVPESNVETTIIVAETRTLLQTVERDLRADRRESLESRPLQPLGEREGNPYYDFTYTVLVPLLVLLPAFISGSITVDSLTEEVERETLEVLRVAPITLTQIVDGKAAAAIVIAPIQAITWLGLITLNGTPVANLGWLFVLASALAIGIVSIAVATALLAADRRSAQLLYAVSAIALFAGTAVLAGGPTNAIARLAIDSADAAIYASVVVVVVAAIVAYGGVRVIVSRVDPNEL